MKHFSCDLCGLRISEERYTARLELAPAFDPDQIQPADLDVDHLSLIAETIEQMESTGEFELEDHDPKQFEFDLCPTCHQRLLKDPLGRATRRRMNFSEN